MSDKDEFIKNVKKLVDKWSFDHCAYCDPGTLVSVDNIRLDPQVRLTPLLSDSSVSILEKIREQPVRFGDWFKIQRGVQPYSRKKHSEKQIAQKFLHSDRRINNEYLPELQGKELSRYHVKAERESYIRYCDEIASIRDIGMF